MSRCAAKIDFSKSANDTEIAQPAIKDEKKDEEGKDATAQIQSSLWPWDSVRNKLKDAYTEVCVLSDVLSIAKEKRFMVLDPIPQEPPEVKPMAQVYARKKALANAANVLLTGAERLKASYSEQTTNKSDFHFELLKLRRNWRLKKVSNTIIGDLSYRTVNNKFQILESSFTISFIF